MLRQEKPVQYVHCDDCGKMVLEEETKFITLPHDGYHRRWCLCDTCGRRACKEANYDWDKVH